MSSSSRHASSSSPSCQPGRREFLAAGASLLGAGLLARVAQAGAVSREVPAPKSSANEDLLDEGLERIAAHFPDVNIHASNHSGMVVESLSALGHGAEIERWLDANLARFRKGRGPSDPIDRERWREALTDWDRSADWHLFFRNEIEEHGAEAVLKTWVPRFAPAMSSVAAHGVIRTAHAARAIAVRASAPRKFELATGLTYWAVNYERIPWDCSLAPRATVAAAIDELKPTTHLPGLDSLVAGLRLLHDMPDFRGVAGWIDASDPPRALTEITHAFAGLYLRNPEQRIAFCHSVTTPAALRLLAPYLDAEFLSTATRYAWQTSAGIYVVYGVRRPPVAFEREPLPRAEIVARAVERGKAHGIKLAEACLREDALAHDPVLIRAAEDAAHSLAG